MRVYYFSFVQATFTVNELYMLAVLQAQYPDSMFAFLFAQVIQRRIGDIGCVKKLHGNRLMQVYRVGFVDEQFEFNRFDVLVGFFENGNIVSV